ncbi:TonB-dependent receptor [Methylophaga sp.]|uniref:TonB-dependent receptor n=1 Tax=Methylophaga sp. TaxID=2024840 RepID=UPI003A92F1AC
MRIKSTCMMLALAMGGIQNALADEVQTSANTALELDTLSVTASADASAEGLSPAFAGGQVAEGGRAGILGTKDNLDTPFSITSYTNEFIQDRQAQSVGDVLRNDPTVRVARGFGNFQESYFIRGFILNSDDVAYNGLYSLLPRQYIATELFERVEVLRGATAFLTGANPNGGGIGGAINLLPKRAPNYDLNRITLGASVNDERNGAADIARRFGEYDEFGIRVNAAHHNGGTSIDDEQAELNLFNIGLDYQGERLRLSADMGYQNHQLAQTRTNLRLMNAVSNVPSTPNASENWAQPWSYSNEKDYFGTFRGEYDFTENITAWAAYGMRHGEEENSLSNLNITNGITGNGTLSRFDNGRIDRIQTGEVGIKGKFNTGVIKHELVAAYSYFESEKKNAFRFVSIPGGSNLYNPTYYTKPALADLYSPRLGSRVRLNSFALGDTLSFMDDRLLLTLGARHQTLKTEDYDYNGQTGLIGKYDDSEVTPAIGAVYKLTEEFAIYANYIESLTKGDTADSTTQTNSGSNVTVVNAGESFAPYVSEQKEIGLKYETNSFGAGLAYFTTSKPRSFMDKSNPDRPVFRQSGEDEHQGVELTLYGKATDDLKLLGGVTWLDAKQKDTGDSSIDDNRVIGVAKWQATVGAEWEVPSVNGLALDGRVNYTGSRYADDANTLKVDGWTTIDIGAKYLIQLDNQDLTLRARVDNLFDRDYWASVGGYPGNGYLVLGAPRTVSISATVDFY